MRQPIKFLPYLKSTERGGEEISRFKDLCINCKTIGESWELSAVPGCESIVMEGDECGMTLTDLVRKHRHDLVGEYVYGQYGDRFPLVLKLVDSDNCLSLHVLDHEAQSCYTCKAEERFLPMQMREGKDGAFAGIKVCHEEVEGSRHISNHEDSFMGIVCVDGGGQVKVDGISTPVKKGETLLIPARTDEFDVEGTLSLLTIVMILRSGLEDCGKNVNFVGN